MTTGRRVFDAHLHIVDPRFPLVPNDGYLPPEFTVADYRRRVHDLGVCGGAVVSGSFQAFDQAMQQGLNGVSDPVLRQALQVDANRHRNDMQQHYDQWVDNWNRG